MNDLIFAVFFVATFMFWVGLEIEKAQLLTALQSRVFITRALIANLALVPSFGFLLNAIFDLPRESSLGLLLIALAPGGLFALNFARVAKANLPYTVALMFVLGGISIVLAPFLSYWLSNEIATHRPGIRMTGLFALSAVLPLLFGTLIREKSKPVATVLRRPMNLISFGCFVAGNVAAMATRRHALQTINSETLTALCLLVIGGWIIGWFMAAPDAPIRRSLAITTSLRNVAISLLICSPFPADSPTVAVIIAFNAISVPMNMVFALILGRLTKRQSDS